MGIGARLMDSILSEFMRKILQNASLEVRITNVKAQKFYKRMDFIPCWIERGYYSDGEDGVIMKKRLTPFAVTFLENTGKPVLPEKERVIRFLDYV